MNRTSSPSGYLTFATCFKLRWGRWLTAGIVAFAIILLISLFFAPRTYTSKLSLSVALPTEQANPLTSMAGLGASPTAKYIGVLRSRRFAEEIEVREHLRPLFGLPSEADMVDLILSGLTVTDNTREGLISLSLTLPAPASLPRPSPKRSNQIKRAVASAMNRYSDVLRAYLATSDFDRDSLLLNGAQERVKEARRAYDDSVASLAELVRKQSVVSIPAVGNTNNSVSHDSGGPEVAVKELETLYTSRATLEGQLRSLQAIVEAGNRLRSDQIAHIDNLPTEDPLLPKARSAANSARSDYEALRLQFGPDHPRVILAQDRLRLAERNLKQETSSIKQGYTSQSIEASTKLSGLTMQYNTVLRQIAQAEQGAQAGQTYFAEYGRRRNEVELRLEILKSVSTQAANLSVQLVSATKRLNIIDVARPARSAYPGVLLLTLFAFFLTGLILTVWILIEVAIAARAASASSTDSVSRAA